MTRKNCIHVINLSILSKAKECNDLHFDNRMLKKEKKVGNHSKSNETQVKKRFLCPSFVNQNASYLALMFHFYIAS